MGFENFDMHAILMRLFERKVFRDACRSLVLHLTKNSPMVAWLYAHTGYTGETKFWNDFSSDKAGRET